MSSISSRPGILRSSISSGRALVTISSSSNLSSWSMLSSTVIALGSPPYQSMTASLFLKIRNVVPHGNRGTGTFRYKSHQESCE